MACPKEEGFDACSSAISVVEDVDLYTDATCKSVATPSDFVNTIKTVEVKDVDEAHVSPRVFIEEQTKVIPGDCVV